MRTLLKAAVDLQIADPYPEIAIGYTGNIMTGIVFDTLSAAEALESAGVERDQAEAISSAIDAQTALRCRLPGHVNVEPNSQAAARLPRSGVWSIPDHRLPRGEARHAYRYRRNAASAHPEAGDDLCIHRISCHR